jgi:hypothetical protein
MRLAFEAASTALARAVATETGGLG